MPPPRPFGAGPPPPKRVVRRVSSFWMRCQASLGSGADIAASSVGGRGRVGGRRWERWRGGRGEAESAATLSLELPAGDEVVENVGESHRPPGQ